MFAIYQNLATLNGVDNNNCLTLAVAGGLSKGKPHEEIN